MNRHKSTALPRLQHFQCLSNHLSRNRTEFNILLRILQTIKTLIIYLFLLIFLSIFNSDFLFCPTKYATFGKLFNFQHLLFVYVLQNWTAATHIVSIIVRLSLVRRRQWRRRRIYIFFLHFFSFWFLLVFALQNYTTTAIISIATTTKQIQ